MTLIHLLLVFTASTAVTLTSMHRGTIAFPMRDRTGNSARDMVWILEDEFSMGSNRSGSAYSCSKDPLADAQPAHRVFVHGFWMDRTAINNKQFARFVSTNHVGFRCVSTEEKGRIKSGSPR